MDINAANLAQLKRNYLLDWKNGLGWKPGVDITFMFRDFPSTTAGNFYAWLDKFPGFREWVGERVFNNVAGQRYEVLNRHFEDSVSMPMNDIDDDQYGVYGPMVQMMSENWMELKYYLAIEALLLNPLCFTGKTFFATDHKYGKNTINNKGTVALSKTTFEAAWTAMSTYKFANNELCRAKPTHLVYGPALHATAHGIVVARQITDGDGNLVDNPNYNRAIPVELAEFSGTYANYWMLLDCSRPIKPVARQIRKEASPFMDIDPATVQRLGRYDILADGRAAAAPTFPHLAYGGLVA